MHSTITYFNTFFKIPLNSDSITQIRDTGTKKRDELISSLFSIKHPVSHAVHDCHPSLKRGEFVRLNFYWSDAWTLAFSACMCL
jgi:hypothetical protein